MGKKIREDSIMSRAANVSVGDHIAKINGTDLTGCRHFEVARMLKEIPIGSEFTLTAVEPKKSFDEIAGRGAKPAGSTEVAAGAGKKTLRMKATGGAVVEDVPSDAIVAIVSKIDDLLEVFAGQLDEKLTDFEFPDDFVLDCYEIAHKN